MTQKQTSHRRAAALLLAAVALPFTPALAQDTVTPADPPIVDVTPPPVTTPDPVVTPTPVQPVVTAPTPVVTTPPVSTQPVATPRPVLTTPAPTVESAPVRQRTVQRTTTTATRQRAADPAPARASAAPAETVAAPDANAPVAATPPLAEEAAPETLPVETLPADTPSEPATLNWTLIAAGAAMLIALLGFLGWRRRRTRDEAYGDVYEERAVYEEPAVPVAAAPVAAAAAPAAFVAAEPEGEPQIEFEMRPVRAGVGDDAARVEFELGVANRGSAPARDVRVSAWMLGSAKSSEMEQSLIDHVDLSAGEDANVEASVAVPRSGLDEDAILPVVVTEARWVRPDGSEGRTTATYEVGVPDGDEMIYFDVENPSGLHDGVIAREVDELERA